MDEGVATPLGRGTFRATITGVGRLGPIEERLGRRLVRIVRPDSKEGQALVRTRQVKLIGPEGTALGQVDLQEARRRLTMRLKTALEESGRPEIVQAIKELVRLRRAEPVTRARS